jgi:hypothetical protein
MTIALSDTISRAPALAQRLFEGSMLVITAKDSMLHRFNEVGTFIWRAIEQPRTVGDICALVAGNFADAQGDEVTRDALSFLQELRGKGMIVVNRADGA